VAASRTAFYYYYTALTRHKSAKSRRIAGADVT